MIFNSPLKAPVLLLLTPLIMASGLDASTVAYWRFEAGPADANVSKEAVPGGPTFHASVPDSSGSGNALSVWETGGGAGYAYKADTSGPIVPLTGLANNFSVRNTGGGPAMFSQTGGALQSWTPSAFTIEASIKPENGSFRTIVGRDSRGALASDLAVAAMYFQITSTNALAFKYLDLSGGWHEAISADNAIKSWNPAGGSPADVPWQHIAAVSDGANLSILLDSGTGYTSLKTVALTGANTGLAVGAGDGNDWDAGVFSVGRGLYNGNHGDRAYGLIDEVRFSDTALASSQLLNAVPEPGGLVLGILGALGLAGRRRR